MRAKSLRLTSHNMPSVSHILSLSRQEAETDVRV
ncbi:rCG27616 [Rattus norvegicus]|uniref:RCG27616 n=1 Tax=Rattus norvegicus TaxID=10116 RepID=A6KBH8_RAT|nr:rCG27616 [Rattus norvegicus]